MTQLGIKTYPPCHIRSRERESERFFYYVHAKSLEKNLITCSMYFSGSPSKHIHIQKIQRCPTVNHHHIWVPELPSSFLTLSVANCPFYVLAAGPLINTLKHLRSFRRSHQSLLVYMIQATPSQKAAGKKCGELAGSQEKIKIRHTHDFQVAQM